MRRREFIGLLGSATAWPVAARGQQPDRVRRIGVLMTIAEDDPEAQARFTTFRAHLEQLGWTERHNVQIDTRFAGPASSTAYRGRAVMPRGLRHTITALAPNGWSSSKKFHQA